MAQKKLSRAQYKSTVGMGILILCERTFSIETIRQLMDHGYGIIGQRYCGPCDYLLPNIIGVIMPVCYKIRLMRNVNVA